MTDPITRPELIIAKDTELYGLRVPKGSSRLAVELQCYRENRGEELGGVGAEEHFKRAWRLAWPGFAWNDWVELLLWAWCAFKLIGVIGHTRASKTYGMAHAAYLDYCASPFDTMTSLTTVTFDGLKIRMWADLMAAVENASFPCPFVVRNTDNILRIHHGDPEQKQLEKFIIEGFATSKTKDSAGRIQGKHAARRRVVLDEAQELPPAIYRALANARSAPDFKAALLANPVEKQSDFGEHCEPENGWSSVHDSDLFWRTKDGNVCLHFDGLQSPNVKAGRVVFDFLIRPDYIESIRQTNGEDSLEWWMYVRGFFPPDGVVAKVWPDTLLERINEPLTFDFPPTKCASLDPAYEWDDCVLQFGEYGSLRGGGMGVNGVATEKILTKTGRGHDPKDYQIAHRVMQSCREHGVEPKDFIMDKTGGGRGVFAILQKEWSWDVHGTEYGGSATKRPLKKGEDDTCDDLFIWFVSELWFRGPAWAEEHAVGGLKRLDAKTRDDLAARRYTVRTHKERKKRAVETKDEVKKRLGRSPDYGDAFSQFFELLALKGHFPGRGRGLNTGSKWEDARKRAIKAGRRWNERAEFSHF